jgi:hypothetical protein
MDDNIEEVVEEKKSNRALLVSLFVFSFLVFLYLSFPFSILKESLSNTISDATGYNLKIGEMSPSFLNGIELSDIEVSQFGDKRKLKIKYLEVSVNPFYLFVGTVRPSIYIEDPKGGSLSAGASIGALGLLSSNVIPKRVYVESKGFDIGGIASFSLGAMAKTVPPQFRSLLKDVELEGDLVSDIDLSIDTSEVTQSLGRVSLGFKGFELGMGEESSPIPRQKFKKANITAKLDAGTLNISKSSEFASNDMFLSLSGKVKLDPRIEKSQMDLIVGLKLQNKLKDNYGFLVDAAFSGSYNGAVSMSIRGPVTGPSVSAGKF